jgi:hypothetical protein
MTVKKIIIAIALIALLIIGWFIIDRDVIYIHPI